MLACDWSQCVSAADSDVAVNVKLVYFSYQMAAYNPGAFYKTKMRVYNNIYETVLAAHLFEDVRVRGELSSVIKSLDPAISTSTVVGNFRYPVEILSVKPVENPAAGGDAFETAQIIEIKVILETHFKFLLFILS